jgi:prefoldin alpha subunit
MKPGKIKEESDEDRQREMQAKIIEIQMLENRLRQLEQSLNFIDQQIMEQQMLQLNLDELKKTKKGQEMLFPLGKNVFVKGKVENHEVFVNIGSNIILKKDEEKSKETVERQKLQLANIRDEIAREIEKIVNQISMIERSFH